MEWLHGLEAVGYGGKIDLWIGGHRGFIKPSGACDQAYAKLVMHPYTNERWLAGDDGGHDGVLAFGVVAQLVASDGSVAESDIRELPWPRAPVQRGTGVRHDTFTGLRI